MWKKVMVKTIVILCSSVFALYLIFCFIYGVNRTIRLNHTPFDHENSIWIAENGNISFKTEDRLGEIITEDRTVKFLMRIDMSYGLYLYPSDAKNFGDNMIEQWRWSYRGQDKFVATVIQSSYFEEGEKITFYRFDADEIEGH